MSRNTLYMKADGTWNNQQTLIINNPIYNNSAKKREMRRKAERELKPHSLKMWLELSDNIDGFEWKLSKKFFETECGIPESSYKDAKKELEAAGYIVWTARNDKGNGVFGYFNVCGKYVPAVAEKKEKKSVAKNTSSVKSNSAADITSEDLLLFCYLLLSRLLKVEQKIPL